ncbi:hypothetical protein [Phaeobacter inhibens]|uniref:hypothetical protein n=1 Tax=Phaeobacter inhibens TaxID=221822 RepID=UPI000CA195ED|nr:hypothetical protein [Phaeobacter inhibens]AUR22533.1 hypothetical protein PhaeoP80_04510 [Phaeobacter inhibens]
MTKVLSATDQEILRQMDPEKEWTYPSHEGWMIRTFSRLVEHGYAEFVFDSTCKQWDGRMWRRTEAGNERAKAIPEKVPGLKRPLMLWDGQ